MLITTVIFKFIPGDEINHAPTYDGLHNTIPVFSTHGVSETNKISDTINVENSLRTIVRSWPNRTAAEEFAAALQAQYTETGDSVPWPGRLVSVEISDQ